MLKLSLKSYTPTLCTRLNIPWQTGAPALSRGTDFLERKTVSAADYLSSPEKSALPARLTTVTTIWSPYTQTPAKPMLKKLHGRFV